MCYAASSCVASTCVMPYQQHGSARALRHGTLKNALIARTSMQGLLHARHIVLCRINNMAVRAAHEVLLARPHPQVRLSWHDTRMSASYMSCVCLVCLLCVFCVSTLESVCVVYTYIHIYIYTYVHIYIYTYIHQTRIE